MEQRDGLYLRVAGHPEEHLAVVAGGIETIPIKTHLRHLREVFHEPVCLALPVNQPDSAVRHTVGREPRVLAAGKGGDLSCHGNPIIRHVVKVADEMHASTIVEKQGLLVAPARADHTEVKVARANDSICGNVEQGDAVLADDEQLVAIIHAFQTKGAVNALQKNDAVDGFPVNNHQVAGMADGVVFAVLRSKAVAEAIVVVAHHPRGM